MLQRPRRNRQSAAIRQLTRETSLSAGDFVYPLFIHEDHQDIAIESMPGCTRWSIDGLVKEAGEAHALGVPAVVIFPAVPENKKNSTADECYNPSGLVQQAVRALKIAHPSLCVITDIALDPYNSDGHDGVVQQSSNGEFEILNDETIEILCKQAISHAEAGVDIISPSDMMDGRVGALRKALDQAGHTNISILSYSAKYASAYYGPFRGALDSAPKAGDKKTYQMDYSNTREAIREIQLDEQEGADMLMIKPAGAYLDIITKVRENSNLPIAAYQVSGEYLMIKSASAAGWLNEKAIVLESLTSIKRAGADIILSYYAKDVAQWLKD